MCMRVVYVHIWSIVHLCREGVVWNRTFSMRKLSAAFTCWCTNLWMGGEGIYPSSSKIKINISQVAIHIKFTP